MKPCKACELGKGKHKNLCPNQPKRAPRTTPPAGAAVPRYGEPMVVRRVTPSEWADIQAARANNAGEHQ